MSITPIKKINVTEEVFEQMKGLLISGEWKCGEKLPSENEMAELFNVSRVTVRQALQKLAVMGLVETRLGEGSFVKEVEPGNNMNILIPAILFNKDMMEQIMEFREIIEVEAIRLAAVRAGEEGVRQLRDILEMMEASKEDFKRFAIVDLDFHAKIWELTQNDFIKKTYNILQSTLQEAMYENIDRMGCEPGIRYHRLMIEAIEAKDGKSASEIMKEHLAYNRKFY